MDQMWQTPPMSVEVLKQEIASLRSEERDQLFGYMLHLRNVEEDPGHIARVTALLDDDAPGRWVSLEEVRQRIGELDRNEDAAE
jgi:hypothetical protein